MKSKGCPIQVSQLSINIYVYLKILRAGFGFLAKILANKKGLGSAKHVLLLLLQPACKPVWGALRQGVCVCSATFGLATVCASKRDAGAGVTATAAVGEPGRVPACGV
jgi:hypothetical protein